MLFFLSDSLGSSKGGEVWRGGKPKKRLSTQTDRPRPRCAAIVPVLSAVAGGGCKTPAPLQQNPLPVLWGRIWE